MPYWLRSPACERDFRMRHSIWLDAMRVDQAGVIAHGPRRLDHETDRRYLARLYFTATAFVTPSLHEPCRAVSLEAAAAGIPSMMRALQLPGGRNPALACAQYSARAYAPRNRSAVAVNVSTPTLRASSSIVNRGW